MNLKFLGLLVFFCQVLTNISGQDSIPGLLQSESKKSFSINGFIRGGGYYDLNRSSGDPYISSGFSDFGLKVESTVPSSCKAFADIRFRYGSEFNKPVSAITIREAYVQYSGRKWNISMGQEILKWGRADFTNPT
jgi:hypothetical protein